jgi:hypothetical protein
VLTAAFFNLHDEPKALVHVDQACNGTRIRFSARGGSDVEIILADSTLKDLFLKLAESEPVGPALEQAIKNVAKRIGRKAVLKKRGAK